MEHPGGNRLQPVRRRPADAHHVQHVLQDDRVVHHAALEMSAVRQDLLVELLPVKPPPPRVVPAKAAAAENEGFQVGQQMIGPEMPFEMAFQPRHLFRQRCAQRFGRFIAAQPFHPIDDPEARRIRIPPRRAAAWVLGDPARDEVLGRGARGRVGP